MNTRPIETQSASSPSSSGEVWIVRCRHEVLSPDDLAKIADLAKVARTQQWTWIKLERRDLANDREHAAMQIAKLAASLPGDRWRLVGSDWLRPGMRVPDLELPNLAWQSLRDVIRFQLPRIEVAARVSQDERISLRLVRGGSITHCEGLLTNVSVLARWVQSAPESRLRSLRWVITSSTPTKCLVLGKELPPVAGLPLVNRKQILIPAGFTWTPNVSASDVRNLFGLSATQWLLWESDQTSSTVEDDAYATMNRASVRELISMQDKTTGDASTAIV